MEKTIRSPTLDTIKMIEKTIEKYSGEYNKTQLWKKLPKKVMWQTYITTLDYLESINKIKYTKDKKILYIWNEFLKELIKDRKEIKI